MLLKKRKIQHGRGLMQRGKGLSSIISFILRKIAPYAKKLVGLGGKAIKSKAVKDLALSTAQNVLDGGINVAKDAIKGRSVKKSVATNSKKAAKDLLTDGRILAHDQVTKLQEKRKPAREKREVERKRKKLDIFGDK